MNKRYEEIYQMREEGNGDKDRYIRLLERYIVDLDEEDKDKGGG